MMRPPQYGKPRNPHDHWPPLVARDARGWEWPEWLMWLAIALAAGLCVVAGAGEVQQQTVAEEATPWGFWSAVIGGVCAVLAAAIPAYLTYRYRHKKAKMARGEKCQ